MFLGNDRLFPVHSYYYRNWHSFRFENGFPVFRAGFIFFAPSIGFCPTVSTVIDQLIFNNIRRILHAKLSNDTRVCTFAQKKNNVTMTGQSKK